VDLRCATILLLRARLIEPLNSNIGER